MKCTTTSAIFSEFLLRTILRYSRQKLLILPTLVDWRLMKLGVCGCGWVGVIVYACGGEL